LVVGIGEKTENTTKPFHLCRLRDNHKQTFYAEDDKNIWPTMKLKKMSPSLPGFK